MVEARTAVLLPALLLLLYVAAPPSMLPLVSSPSVATSTVMARQGTKSELSSSTLEQAVGEPSVLLLLLLLLQRRASGTFRSSIIAQCALARVYTQCSAKTPSLARRATGAGLPSLPANCCNLLQVWKVVRISRTAAGAAGTAEVRCWGQHLTGPDVYSQQVADKVHRTLAGVSCVLGRLIHEHHPSSAAAAADRRCAESFCCCHCRGEAICCGCEDCAHVLQQP